VAEPLKLGERWFGSRCLGRRAAGRVDRAAVRAWARDAGLAVSERGRISAEVMRLYDAAH